MPRVREFDEDDALERAMRLFWRRGYRDTSVRDLVEYTGVAHAGLYAAFGDKERLFGTALQHYADEQQATVFAPLDAPGAGRKQIEEFFGLVVSSLRDGRFSNGCMIATTAAEWGDEKGRVQKILLSSFKRHRRAFANALKNAKAAGDVAADLNVRRTAALMATAFYGLSAQARAGAPTAMIEDAARAAIDLMD